MTDLVLAIPSKGRLEENAAAFFAGAGLAYARSGGARNYRGRIAGLDGVEVAFLSAGEIARELAAGNVHFGVTGEDLVRERIANPDRTVHLVTGLDFGEADVVVAVPQAWIDVATMDDLEEVAAGFRARHGRRLRVATKYFNLTRAFFSDHGIVAYHMVESLGATEGAPAAGAADIIVDITTTGSTLAANHLKVLDDGVILRSQANLVAALNADWSKTAITAGNEILNRIAASRRARTMREIAATVGDKARAGREAVERFGCRLPHGAVGGPGPLILHCPAANLWDCVNWLQDTLMAETVTVTRPTAIFEARNPIAETLFSRLHEHLETKG